MFESIHLALVGGDFLASLDICHEHFPLLVEFMSFHRVVVEMLQLLYLGHIEICREVLPSGLSLLEFRMR